MGAWIFFLNISKAGKIIEDFFFPFQRSSQQQAFVSQNSEAKAVFPNMKEMFELSKFTSFPEI